MHDNASRQLAGAKRLSGLLKLQALLEDAPVELQQLDPAEEERRALLRTAWSTAMGDNELPDLDQTSIAAEAGKEKQQSGNAPQQARPVGATQDDYDEDMMVLSTLGFGDISFEMVSEALAVVDALGALPRRGGMPSGGVMVDFTARGGQFALAAALLHPFDYVLGVEANEEQCDMARERLVSLQHSLEHLVGNDDQLTWEVCTFACACMLAFAFMRACMHVSLYACMHA